MLCLSAAQDATAGAIAAYDEARERYIPVLMAQAQIDWDAGVLNKAISKIRALL
jgi:hypothetical protein